MGFFDGLLKKKQCSICGKEMGLLERKELAGGNLCDDCADKLSPWFTTEARKASTPQQIQEQLQYREQNKMSVQQFKATRTIGKYSKVYIDEMNRKFMVSRESNLLEENPDVIDASSIVNVAVDTRESKHELKDKDEEGRSVSFNPPRYDYSYDFYVDIDVNHPYAKHICIKVNSSSVWVRYDYLQSRGMTGFGNSSMGNSFNGNMNTAAGILGAVITGLQNGMAGNNNVNMYPPEYRENLAIAEDMRVSLLNLRNPGSAVPNPSIAGMGNGMGTVAGMAGMAGMQPGFQQQGYPQQGMQQQMYPGQGMPQQQMYQGQGMQQQMYPGQGMPQQQMYPQQGFQQQGYPGQGMQQQQMYPGQGMPQQQMYPQQGFQQQGYPGQGMQQQQMYPGQGMPQQGYPQQGMPQQGYPQQAPQPGMDKWFCPNCGTPNDGQFCAGCGAPKPN